MNSKLFEPLLAGHKDKQKHFSFAPPLERGEVARFRIRLRD